MKTKLTIYSAILLLLTVATGCKEDEFKYDLVEVSPGDVTEIYFSPGAEMMIADGKATLKFIVETYRDYKREDGTVIKTRFDYHQLPEGSVRIFEETTNQEVGLTFKTSSASAGNLRFYAQVGNVKSAVKEVKLRLAPAALQKLYVDVIFHVWELNPTNSSFDPSSFQPITYSDVVSSLEVMNDVVNNRLGNNANGASANIEFRMATKNQAGLSMEFPGFNRIVYSDEVKRVPTSASFSLLDFQAYIDLNKAAYVWNPKQYLNVHVLPYGSATGSPGNAMPAKQLPPGSGESLIPGITGIAANADDFVTALASAAVTVPNTLFRPGYERRIEIFSIIGGFYGLWPTSAYVTSRFHSDFCEDTPLYNPAADGNDFFFALKTGLNGEKFVIENAMDDSRYPSARNSITLDQVNRMRSVMLRCPGRMNSKTQ